MRRRGWQLLLLIATLVGISIALSAQYNLFLTLYNESTSSREGLAFRVLHLLFMLFGFLLVLSLSHHSIKEDLHSGRLRLYLSQLSYGEIIAGKFLGISTFWFAAITLCYFILVILYGAGSWRDLGNMIAMITFATGTTILLASYFNRSSSILLAGLAPWSLFLILGFADSLGNSEGTFRWLLPPFWVLQTNPWAHAVPILTGICFSLLAIPILRRRGI